MTVYYTSQGLADIEPGLTDFREGLTFLGVTGAMETEAEEGEDDFTPDQPCEPGYICVTVSADELTGGELNYMLYETTEADWPGQYLGLPTPSWVVTETVPVPDTFPIHIRIPLEGNLFAVGGQEIEGARLGLAVVTGVASIFIVEPDDARGFSDSTLVCQAGVAMNYGEIDLAVPQGDVADLDGDGNQDIVMVGEPHFEWPDLRLTELKLGVYYLNADFTLKGTEIIDQWSEADPLYYSPWGVNVIDHGGEPKRPAGPLAPVATVPFPPDFAPDPAPVVGDRVNGGGSPEKQHTCRDREAR